MPPFVAHSPSKIVRGTASLEIGSSGQITITPTSGQHTTLASGQLRLPAGTSAAPTICRDTGASSGFYFRSTVDATWGSSGTAYWTIAPSLMGLHQDLLIAWRGPAVDGTTNATLSRVANGSLAIGGIGNGQLLGLKQLTELTTVAAAAFTDTTIQIPADAIVLGVSVRVTTVIPTAATFDVGVAGATTRYGTGIAVAAGTTNKGTADPLRYAAAVSVRITPDLTPADNSGRVRVTIMYLDVTAPTS